LDLLTIPAHTSHALQPLDVSVFKPFKQHFREYHDFWSSRNLNESATKDTLAHWVSLALRKALSASNIKKGFSATGIFPVNASAVDSHMLPSHVYESPNGQQQSPNGQQQSPDGEQQSPNGDHQSPNGDQLTPNGEQQSPTGTQLSPLGQGDSYMQTDIEHRYEEQGIDREGEMCEESAPVSEPANIEADFAEVPHSTAEHFFVDVDPLNPCGDDELVGLEAGGENAGSITRFLTLPTVAARANARHRDPIMDFSKSIMLTSNEYMAAAASVAESKANAAREKEIARAEKEERRKRKQVERDEERRAKEIRANQLAEARAQKMALREEARAAKEARAAEAAHARALKAAEKEHAKRLRAERAIQAADARAQREGSKARRAAEALSRAMEMAQGRQAPSRHPGSSSTQAAFFDATLGRLQPTQACEIPPAFGGFVTLATSTRHSPPGPPPHHRVRRIRPLQPMRQLQYIGDEVSHPFSVQVFGNSGYGVSPIPAHFKS
jgi:hypothetical protein